MFKGGTSLSKVFNLIGRFSEDIDLILDWRLVSGLNPMEKQPSKNKQIRFNEQINENAKIYIKNELLPIISQILSPLCSCTIAEDGFSINVKYPNAFDDNYLRPEILLEIGPLASWLPSDSFEISSFAAIKFPVSYILDILFSCCTPLLPFTSPSGTDSPRLLHLPFVFICIQTTLHSPCFNLFK